MQLPTLLILLITTVPCLCQRPFYAGLRPVGIPAVNKPAVALDNRISNDLPAVLNGDKEYADRLDKMPEGSRPIWFLNPKQYEDQLKNPKTYPLRPSYFNESG